MKKAAEAVMVPSSQTIQLMDCFMIQPLKAKEWQIISKFILAVLFIFFSKVEFNVKLRLLVLGKTEKIDLCY